MSHRNRLSLHADASAESVAMIRVGVFLLCALEGLILMRQVMPIPLDALTPFGFLTMLPPGVLAWMTSANGQYLLLSLGVGSALAAVVGVAPRFSMPVATVCFVVTQALPRALQAVVNHAQVPVMLAAMLLSLGPSTDALVLWPKRPRDTRRDPGAYQATLVLIVAMICVGYTFIASHRLAYGGWALFSSDSLSQWLVQRNLSATNPEASLGLAIVRTPWLATAAQVSFPLLTSLELLAPLCLFSRRFRWVFVPGMLAAHAGIYLLMHISFSQLACLYVLFIDSASWSPRHPAVDAQGKPQPLLVFFDGVCGLCNRFVDFLVARDRNHALRFASLQGQTAATISNMPAVDSVIVADGDALRIRSDGAIAALSRLGGLWSFVAVFGLIPATVRDVVYAFIARNRYRWFGKYDACRLPTAAEQHWFLP